MFTITDTDLKTFHQSCFPLKPIPEIVFDEPVKHVALDTCMTHPLPALKRRKKAKSRSKPAKEVPKQIIPLVIELAPLVPVSLQTIHQNFEQTFGQTFGVWGAKVQAREARANAHYRGVALFLSSIDYYPVAPINI